MDAIRLRQIDEVLGYDKKINAMVFGIDKKREARYPDERPDLAVRRRYGDYYEREHKRAARAPR